MKSTTSTWFSFHFLTFLLTIGPGLLAQQPAEPPPATHTNTIDFDPAVVFDEVVTIVGEQFWDRNFDITAWRQHADSIRTAATEAQSRDEFSAAVNQLLGGLNTSHTRYFSKSDPKRYQLLGIFHRRYSDDPDGKFIYPGIGIDTKVIDGGNYVTAVLDGFPAHEAGLKYGDQILAINGQSFHPIDSFVGKVGDSVSIEVQRGGEPLQVNVSVEWLDGRTMFEKALTASQRVIEREGKKIGYIHAWSYAGNNFHEQIRSSILWGDLSQCDGLVLDLRDGWGGADVNHLNLFRQPIVKIETTSRSGEPQNYTGVWGKPVTLITNSGTTSGKEIFAVGFRKLGLGKIIGQRTAGAVVAGQSFLLSNQDVLYLAVTDIKVDGIRLEGQGVEPDLTVDRLIPAEGDSDPQLEAAVNELIRQPLIRAPE